MTQHRRINPLIHIGLVITWFIVGAWLLGEVSNDVPGVIRVIAGHVCLWASGVEAGKFYSKYLQG